MRKPSRRTHAQGSTSEVAFVHVLFQLGRVRTPIRGNDKKCCDSTISTPLFGVRASVLKTSFWKRGDFQLQSACSCADLVCGGTVCTHFKLAATITEWLLREPDVQGNVPTCISLGWGGLTWNLGKCALARRRVARAHAAPSSPRASIRQLPPVAAHRRGRAPNPPAALGPSMHITCTRSHAARSTLYTF